MLHILQHEFGLDWTAYSLFLCHFLSTWNARSYEFASVSSIDFWIFLRPDYHRFFSQLQPIQKALLRPHGCQSLGHDRVPVLLSNLCCSGITVHVAIILFASSLGRWVDHAPSRLRTLLTTVSINRIVVIISCLCWTVVIGGKGQVVAPSSEDHNTLNLDARPLAVTRFKDVIFFVILALSVVERLSRLANLVSIERDWIPTLATNVVDDSEAVQHDLTHLNAVMGRIDLVCKLGSPIMISMFMSVSKFPRLGAVILIAIGVITWPLEYWTAQSVWNRVERLREPKTIKVAHTKEFLDVEESPSDNEKQGKFGRVSCWCQSLKNLGALFRWIHEYGSGLRHYFTTDIWMPSLAMTGLHFSVLSFSSTLIVFLVHSGLSMRLITWAEVLSATFELSSTYIFPWGVRHLSARRTQYHPIADETDTVESNLPSSRGWTPNDENNDGDGVSQDEGQRTGVSRLGLLALVLMLLCLVTKRLRMRVSILTQSRFPQFRLCGRYLRGGSKRISH